MINSLWNHANKLWIRVIESWNTRDLGPSLDPIYCLWKMLIIVLKISLKAEVLFVWLKLR
jgi:hypothetical protein